MTKKEYVVYRRNFGFLMGYGFATRAEAEANCDAANGEFIEEREFTTQW